MVVVRLVSFPEGRLFSTGNTQYKVSSPSGRCAFDTSLGQSAPPLDSGKLRLGDMQALTPCTRPKGSAALWTSGQRNKSMLKSCMSLLLVGLVRIGDSLMSPSAVCTPAEADLVHQRFLHLTFYMVKFREMRLMAGQAKNEKQDKPF